LIALNPSDSVILLMLRTWPFMGRRVDAGIRGAPQMIGPGHRISKWNGVMVRFATLNLNSPPLKPITFTYMFS
jgi:hypothetical protein